MCLPPLVKYASVDEYLKHYQRVYCRGRIYTLGHPKADLYQGWIKNARRHDPVRRFAVVYEQFVVVVSLWKKLDGSLKADFVTSYQADNSISKIRSSPKWSRSDYFHQINQSVSFMK